MPSFERFQSADLARARQPFPVERFRPEREIPLRRMVCLSDIHNDLVAAQASLRQQASVDAHGEWREPVDLMITGDSINRDAPNPEVLKYFRHLRKTAPADCSVKMLVGNHELDVLTRVANGEDVGLKNSLIEFLGSMDVVCRRGPVLYLHRYPSLACVRELWQQYREEGGNPAVWNINRRFQEAVCRIKETPAQSKRVFLECDDGGDEGALGGLSAEAYYEKYGLLIGQFLKEMGVTTVIHGHKKQKEGGQKFEQYIPGIFMVNNDAGISRDKNPEHHHRIGSIEVAPLSDGSIAITCRYKPSIKPKGDTKTQTTTIH
jgi:hypothetical protein